MADYIVKDTELTSVANAIRTAGGTNSLLSFPNGFVSAVGNISDGGSSDFSTAMVTLANATSELVILDTVIVKNNGLDIGLNALNEAVVGEVVLYKGTSYPSTVRDFNGDFVENFTLSGDAIEDGGLILITGDCTITISSGGGGGGGNMS